MGTANAASGSEGGAILRVFCGLELPREIRAAADAHASRLRREFPDARASWARPEGLHITLKFIGEVEAARVEALSRAAETAVKGFKSFGLTIEGAGTFPPHGKARVLWLGVQDESEQLAQLQRRLERDCEAEGFTHEPRDFNPHLTVARLRTPNDAHALSEAHRRMAFGPHRFEVKEFLVIRSELGPGGSRYTPLSLHEFGN